MQNKDKFEKLWNRVCQELNKEEEHNPTSLVGLTKYLDRSKDYRRFFKILKSRPSSCKPHLLYFIFLDSDEAICSKCWRRYTGLQLSLMDKKNIRLVRR